MLGGYAGFTKEFKRGLLSPQNTCLSFLEVFRGFLAIVFPPIKFDNK